MLAAPRRRYGARELGEGSPGGDDGEPDDEVGDAERLGEVDRTPHEDMRRADENGKPDKHLYDGERKTLLARFWRGSDITIRRRTLCTLVVPAVKGQKDGKGDEEDPRVEPSATAIAENEHRKERYGDKPRARDKCCRRPRDKRADERRDAENHRNIENATAVGIAERKVGVARKSRQGAYAKFWRTRPEADDDHAHYERRNAERPGHLSRAVDKNAA